MSHDPGAKCAVNEQMERGLSYEEAMLAVRRRESETLAKQGWYGHLVLDDPDSPTGYNAHSHGIAEVYGHPDFQIVLPMSSEATLHVLANLISDVKSGKRFAPGDRAGEIIHGYDVGFAAATECGRDVLRVILPDQKGKLALGEIGGGLSVQYKGTP